MKNNITRYGLSLLMLLGTIACSSDDIDTYDAGYNAIRFVGFTTDADEKGYYATNSTYYSYSFSDTPLAESYDYDIPLYVIGKTADVDREVNYQIDKEASTAPEGSYEILSASVPAHEQIGTLRVRIANADELADKSYTLVIKLVANEDFRASDEMPYLTTQLSWNNSLPLPTHANLIRTYNMLIAGMSSFVSTSAACLSTNALKAIVAATGWNDWDDATKHTINNASTTYKYYKYLPRYTAIYVGDAYKAYALILRDYLAAYEQEHGTPLLHDSGSLIGQPVTARTY
jgi:hypothetical protein